MCVCVCVCVCVFEGGVACEHRNDFYACERECLRERLYVKKIVCAREREQERARQTDIYRERQALT